jgi:hypothetical protein
MESQSCDYNLEVGQLTVDSHLHTAWLQLISLSPKWGHLLLGINNKFGIPDPILLSTYFTFGLTRIPLFADVHLLSFVFVLPNSQKFHN